VERLSAAGDPNGTGFGSAGMSRPRILLWRHGRTQWNVESRWQGQSDIPLDEVGLEQARMAADALVDYEPTAIFSSDLMRAHDTAKLLAEKVGLPITVDQRLRETDGGEWEGLTQGEIREKYDEHLHRWLNDMSVPAGIRGESRVDVSARISSAVLDIASRFDSGTIVFATHGGAIRDGVAGILGLPAKEIALFKVINNCAWAVVDYDRQIEGWRIAEYNVTANVRLEERHI